MSETGGEQLVVVAVHGRDQTPQYMVDNLVGPLGRSDVTWVLPGAPARQWYSGRASDPLQQNQQELNESLKLLRTALAPHAAERTLLIGFSQGACLLAELLATAEHNYAGAVLLTGTLLGPNPAQRTLSRRLDGMQIVMGLAARDPWMTSTAAADTQHVLSEAGASVDLHIVDSDQHQIHPEDLAATAALIDQLLEETRLP